MTEARRGRLSPRQRADMQDAVDAQADAVRWGFLDADQPPPAVVVSIPSVMAALVRRGYVDPGTRAVTAAGLAALNEGQS